MCLCSDLIAPVLSNSPADWPLPDVISETNGARDTTSRVNRCTYRVEWSPDRDEHVGFCLEFPSLSHYAPSAREAIAGIEEAVDEYVDDMKTNGDKPPEPLAERKYSGTFVVRTSSALHARLVREAAEQGVSMNQWMVQKLAERRIDFGPFGFD